MNTRMDPERTLRPTLAEEAGSWEARLRAPDCTDEDRQRFGAWCDADPTHREAFERLQSFVTLLRRERGRADVRPLRDEGLRQVRSRRHRWLIRAAAAGLMALCLGAVMWQGVGREWARDSLAELTARLTGAEIYSTGIGQRSTYTLKDGSSVELNALSRIQVRFSDLHRSVELLDGQALFNVAKDNHRPFVVQAGNREIVALGTQFDVRLDTTSVQVTLLEGKVRVQQSARPSEPDVSAHEDIELTPGKQFVASLEKSPGSARRLPASPSTRLSRNFVRNIDVAKVTGWRDGRIFLDDLPLEEAVREMNRHSEVQIRIDGTSLSETHVNGMFKAGEQMSFVSALQEYFPIAAYRRGDREIVLTRR